MGMFTKLIDILIICEKKKERIVLWKIHTSTFTLNRKMCVCVSHDSSLFHRFPYNLILSHYKRNKFCEWNFIKLRDRHTEKMKKKIQKHINLLRKYEENGKKRNINISIIYSSSLYTFKMLSVQNDEESNEENTDNNNNSTKKWK